MELKRVGLVVLAAGQGSRFLGPTHKLLAPLQGRPVVVHAVEAALAAVAGPVAVVTGAAALDDVLPPGVEPLHNSKWASGQASSLQLARAWASEHEFDAFVVGLGDQPFVASSCWAALAVHPAELVVATFGGQRRPPVRLGRSVWDALPTDGDMGARELLRSRPADVFEIPCEGNANDIDTVEDLERWT